MHCAKGWCHADLQRAGRRACDGKAGDGGLDALQIAGNCEMEGVSSLGKRQLAGGAVKQPHTQVALQHRNVSADCRRSDGKPPCCLGKAAIGGAADEGF